MSLACLLTLGLMLAGGRGQELADTEQVVGVVRGPLGEALRDAEVRLAPFSATDKALASKRTGADGRFVFKGLAKGAYRVTAAAPGLTTGVDSTLRGPGELDELLELRLWEAGVVRGRILDAEGRPMAGVAVIADSDYRWLAGHFLSPEVATDADGRFRLEGVPIGAFTVRAAKPGFVCLEKSGFLLHEVELDLRLTRGAGCGLRIRVEGLPPGTAAQVDLRSGLQIPRGLGEHVLASDGSCHIDGLPAGRWQIDVSATGYEFQPRFLHADLSAARPSKRVDVEAVALGSLILRGTLRTEDGHALAGLTLSCHGPGYMSQERTTVTDAAGRFVMQTSLLPGEHCHLRLVDKQWTLVQEKTEEHIGYQDKSYVGRHEAKADAKTLLELVATRAGIVSGRVLDELGAPVPHLRMELQVQRPPNHSPRWGAMRIAVSGLDGSYEFAGLPPTDELRVTAQGTHGIACSDPFCLTRSERRRKLDVALRAAGVVEGKVVDSEGRAAAGSLVALRNLDVATGEVTDGDWTTVLADREGRYRFVGVAPGGHRVEVRGGQRGSDVQLSSPIFEVGPGASIRQDLSPKATGR